jgi:hypothetical protein
MRASIRANAFLLHGVDGEPGVIGFTIRKNSSKIKNPDPIIYKV